MSKNILFVGPYRHNENDGWGAASRAYVKALMTTGYNLTLRNMSMINNLGPIPKEFEDLENTKYDNYDAVIYKILPYFCYYDARFGQNICLTVFETKIKKSKNHWLNKLGMMDKVMVPSLYEKSWLSQEIKPPIYDIGEPTDTNKCYKIYKKIEALDNDLFYFYTIGSNSSRKNLLALVKAYFNEFTSNDKVGLVIKTNANITDQITRLKQTMRRFFRSNKYPPIFLIHQNVEEETICSIHQYGHCCVIPSRGEAVNRSAMDALIFGNPVICTENISTWDFLSNDIAYSISSQVESIFIDDPPVPELYTSDETWFEPNILSIQEQMRLAFSGKLLFQHKKNNIRDLDIHAMFSYESVGKRIKAAIE